MYNSNFDIKNCSQVSFIERSFQSELRERFEMI